MTAWPQTMVMEMEKSQQMGELLRSLSLQDLTTQILAMLLRHKPQQDSPVLPSLLP